MNRKYKEHKSNGNKIYKVWIKNGNVNIKSYKLPIKK